MNQSIGEGAWAAIAWPQRRALQVSATPEQVSGVGVFSSVLVPAGSRFQLSSYGNRIALCGPGRDEPSQNVQFGQRSLVTLVCRLIARVYAWFGSRRFFFTVPL